MAVPPAAWQTNCCFVLVGWWQQGAGIKVCVFDPYPNLTSVTLMRGPLNSTISLLVPSGCLFRITSSSARACFSRFADQGASLMPDCTARPHRSADVGLWNATREKPSAWSTYKPKR